MNAVFRIECAIGAGFVEAVVRDLPFMPALGMSIAPLPGADLLKVEDVMWMADKPNVVEVWLTNNNDDVPWSYWKKQGFRKGESA